METLLIAGTDTDAGKTCVTIALTAYWQKYRFGNHTDNIKQRDRLGIFKLLQTGIGDMELYDRLFVEDESIEIIAPLRLAHPLAPPIAAVKEGINIELYKIWQSLNSLAQQQDFVFVEALGGLGSPVTAELTVAHIAADWRLPTILVVPVKLGAISHAVTNVALARSLNLDLRGIILNCCEPGTNTSVEDFTPIDLVQFFTQVPILGVLPHIKEFRDRDKLAQIVSNWDLELILPV
ncbi:MAG: dethiobiotin synthase [Pleurocapsa sp.]